jgi:BASS family bile acid:Na+ symporter
MSGFFGRNFAVVMVLLGIVFGFSLPSIGLLWAPYVSYILMTLIFSTILTMEFQDVVDCARKPASLLYTLLTIFVLGPILALSGRFLFSSETYVGIVLAICAPSAVSAAFFVGIFQGDTAYSLMTSVLTNLLAILTVPTTVFLAVGTSISFDLPSMFLSLIELILVPVVLAFAIQKILRNNPMQFSKYVSKTNPILMLFILWGTTAAGALYIQKNPLQFLWESLFIVAILAALFLVVYGLRKRHSYKQAITMGFVTVVRNGALALIIATTFFTSETISPIVASIVVEHLFLVASGTLFRKTQSARKNVQADDSDTCFEERKTGP